MEGQSPNNNGVASMNSTNSPALTTNVASQSVDSSDLPRFQRQARRELPDTANPLETNQRNVRSRRGQQNITRSSIGLHPHITIVDSSATALGSSSSTATNLPSVITDNQGEISNIVGASSSTYLQRLRPTARRREIIAQAIRASDEVPTHLENTHIVPVEIAPPPALSTQEDHQDGVGLPPSQQQTFFVHNSEGINLSVVLNFEVVHEERPQNNLMLNLDAISDEEINDIQHRIRLNTPLSEEVIMQGLIPRRCQKNAEEGYKICSICQDDLDSGQELVKLDCDHSYHFECIKKWLGEKNFCPVCKNIALPI